MISFQGGGAGWDTLTLDVLPRLTKDLSCQRTIKKMYPEGIYNRSESHELDNAFQGYTIVNVLYCSGDLHAGDVQKRGFYKDNVENANVKQTGYANTMATLNWIETQIGVYLAANLDNLVISGQSAGAIGAQFWSHYILKKFAATKKVVIIDSYLGVLPDNAGTLLYMLLNIMYQLNKSSLTLLVLILSGPVINGFNFCNYAQDFFPPGARNLCPTATSTSLKTDFLQTIVENSMLAHPDVPFAFIQSKQDFVQIGFYELINVDPHSGKGNYYVVIN